MYLGLYFNNHDVSLIKPRRMIYKMTSKNNDETLTSGKGHDLTQTYRDAYLFICLDKTNPSNLF